MQTNLLQETLEVLDCNYGEEPFIPPGKAGKLVRKMNQRRSAHDVKLAKLATGEFSLQWKRSRRIEDTRPPECCGIPLTRQQAFALVVATAAVPDEFLPEIDALWG
jgi:hypothetical protein